VCGCTLLEPGGIQREESDRFGTKCPTDGREDRKRSCATADLSFVSAHQSGYMLLLLVLVLTALAVACGSAAGAGNAHDDFRALFVSTLHSKGRWQPTKANHTTIIDF
jgi:hypothetical protein